MKVEMVTHIHMAAVLWRHHRPHSAPLVAILGSVKTLDCFPYFLFCNSGESRGQRSYVRFAWFWLWKNLRCSKPSWGLMQPQPTAKPGYTIIYCSLFSWRYSVLWFIVSAYSNSQPWPFKASPPMGAAKEQATPTAQAAANISEFRDSFS